MKSTISLASSIGLLLLAFPVAAQESGPTNSGPIHRAVAREAIRLAQAQPHSDSSDRRWAAVRRLPPGAEISLTVRGAEAAKRQFVSASDSVLVALNLTNPSLPAA